MLRAVLLCLLTLVPLAAGQASGAEDSTLTAARQHFENGRGLYRQGRYADAATEFEAAYRMRPHPDLLFNLGQCYQRLGDLPGALWNYAQYLHQAPDAPDRAGIEETMVDLARKLAKTGQQMVIVFSRPPEAVVRIDGKDRGRTPFQTLLPLGAHHLQVAKEDLLPRDVEFYAAEDVLQYDLHLSNAPPQVVTKTVVDHPWRSRAWIPAAAGGTLVLAGGALYLASQIMASQLAQGSTSIASSAQGVTNYAQTGKALQAAGAAVAAGGVVGLALAATLYEYQRTQSFTVEVSWNGGRTAGLALAGVWP